MRVAELDLSMRRFIGYGLTEALPHHSTLSHAQCVRFASSGVFEQLFTQVLAQCRQAGLLDGGRLVVDATHVEADAALKSLRAELTVIDGGSETHADDQADESDGDGGDGAGARPPLALAAPRSGPTPKRTATNATAVSRTDPDGKLRHKPGQRPHLVHRAQIATDPKHRVIVAVAAEQATGFEGDALPELVRRARWAGHQVSDLAADQGYASRSVYQQLERLAVTAFIPPQAAHARTVREAARARARCRTAAGIQAAADRQAHAEGAISDSSSGTASTVLADAAPTRSNSSYSSRPPQSTSNGSSHARAQPRTSPPATKDPPAADPRPSRATSPSSGATSPCERTHSPDRTHFFDRLLVS